MKAAIIGTGFAASHHYNALRGRENVEVVGVWNRRYKELDWASKTKLYVGHGEELTTLLEMADIVVVAIPAGSQLQFVVHPEIQTGQTVILEKPFGTDRHTANVLRREIDRKNLYSCYMPFVWRFNPDIQALFELGLSPSAPTGRLHMVRFYEYVPTPYVQVQNWATMLDEGGGVLANLGSHQIDLLNHFLPMIDIRHGGSTLTFPKDDGYLVTNEGFPLGFIDSLGYQPDTKDGIRVHLTGDIGYSTVIQGYHRAHGDISVTLTAAYGSCSPMKGIELHGEHGTATWHEHGTAFHKDGSVLPIDRGPPVDLQQMYNLFYDAVFSDDQQAPDHHDGALTASMINQIRDHWVYHSSE